VRPCGASARGARRPDAPRDRGAAGGCGTALRGVAPPGQEGLCNRGEHRVSVARGVPSRLPARPPHFPRLVVIPRYSARAEAAERQARNLRRPDLAPHRLPGTHERPAEGAALTRSGRSRTSPGLFVWVSRGRRATCTSPAAGAAGKTRRGGGPGEERRKAARLDLFARDGDRRRERGRSHRAPASPPGQQRPAGWITAPARSSWAPASPRRFLVQPGPGCPAMWP